ncbi:MAG TPA: molybdate ABC transporter substrate-binding protein [Anaerolineales bacterium]|nr:molybdate ABC transporter substrate-binding protein [Anaerolineales bacterium]
MNLSFLPFLLSVVICLVSVLGACSRLSNNSESRSLTVYAAASLTDALTEVGKAFEALHPGVTVSFNFGGSQNLRTQIEQGAPADVFASANLKEMDALVTGSFVDSNAPRIFLTNQLMVILPKNNPAEIASLRDLSKPGLKLVLAAEEVPAGRYAREVLENLNAMFGADYSGQVLANVVSNEDNIRQAVTKVQLGEADASIVYVSDAVAVQELQTLAIPADRNVIAEYPIAPLAESANLALANGFIDYVLSAEGQATLETWGFTPIIP